MWTDTSENTEQRTVGADNHIILPGTAIPFGKVQFPIVVLHKARHSRDMCGDVPVGSRSVTIPAKSSRGKTHEQIMNVYVNAELWRC